MRCDMRIFLAQTNSAEELLKEFKKDPLDFLYHQEDRTGYKIITISYLIDEIQKLPNCETFEEFYSRLSKDGKRRYNTILNQLSYLVEFGWK